MSQRPRVAIVGGGIGGLTAAVAMHRHGIDVKVYEQSQHITEIGAGVSLSPNAIKALRALGLSAPIAAIPKIVVRPAKSPVRVVDSGSVARRS